jgi:hypothetical protein
VTDRARVAASDRFDTTTRRAIREEVEIAIEMLRSANVLGEAPPRRPRRRSSTKQR